MSTHARRSSNLPEVASGSLAVSNFTHSSIRVISATWTVSEITSSASGTIWLRSAVPFTKHRLDKTSKENFSWQEAKPALLEHRSFSSESSFSSTFLLLNLTLIFLFQESLVRAAERREQARDQGGRGDERVGQTPQENRGQRSERAGDRSPLEPELL